MVLPSVNVSAERFGWTAALWGVAALMIIWYLLSAWIEQKKQTGVLQF